MDANFVWCKPVVDKTKKKFNILQLNNNCFDVTNFLFIIFHANKFSSKFAT